MRTKSKISAYILRGSAAALLVSCVIVALSSAINLPNKSKKLPVPENNTATMATSAIRRNQTLTFADRVAYQRGIEEVCWQHRIWPAASPGPKPPLDKVMSQAEIEKKVEDYLRDSQALEDYWQRPITAEQLQAEMERMAQNTKQPQVLHELFVALGNDPLVIAECLARPVLAERTPAIVTSLKEPSRARAETQRLATIAAVRANYILPQICADDTWTPTSLTNAPAGRDAHTAVSTGTEMIIWGGTNGTSNFNTGGRYNPSTDSWTATSNINAPSARSYHTGIWNGSQMTVWGGSFYDGTPSLFEHWGAIQSQHRQLDGHQHHRRTDCPSLSHGSMDRQPNDGLGWNWHDALF